MKKTSYIPIAVSFLFVVIFLIFFSVRTPQFQLQVVNKSSLPVDQIWILGEGVITDVLLFNLPVDGESLLTVDLAASGSVRYEVIQGLNKADMLITADVSKLSSYQRLLTINEGNRYIISRVDAVSQQ